MYGKSVVCKYIKVKNINKIYVTDCIDRLTTTHNFTWKIVKQKERFKNSFRAVNSYLTAIKGLKNTAFFFKL